MATGLLECPPDLEVVLWLEELQEGPLRPPVTEALRDRYRLPRHRVEAGVIHASRDVEWAGDEVLHLVGLVAVALEEHRQVDHLLKPAARVARDEVGDGVLLLADAAAGFLEGLVELDVVVGRRLLHEVQHLGVGVFRGHLEVAADVVGGEFLEVLGISAG